MTGGCHPVRFLGSWAVEVLELWEANEVLSVSVWRRLLSASLLPWPPAATARIPLLVP